MMNSKAKVLSVVAATALALSLSVPAFAAVTDADGTGNYQGTLGTNESFDATTTIEADVAAPSAKIISVTVPSTLALPIATKVDQTKTVLDAANSPSRKVTVKNNAQSTTAVKVALSKVEETADQTSGKFLSSMVKVLLASNDVPAGLTLSKDAAYSDPGNVLVSRIAADGSADLTLSAAELAAAQEVTPGSYTLKTTLKVSAIA